VEKNEKKGEPKRPVHSPQCSQEREKNAGVVSSRALLPPPGGGRGKKGKGEFNEICRDWPGNGCHKKG